MISEEPVPGIPGAVVRRVQALPETLLGGQAAGVGTTAKHGQLLFIVPGTGKFLASDGRLIEYTQEEEADLGKVKLFLQGTARGALIHQRGELPLHAATLVPPDGNSALAICGSSGAGKSTLAAELSRRGWTLVADDTTRITREGADAVAWPSRDSIKLWRDACDAAGFDTSALERVSQDLEKYYIRVPAIDTSVKLKTIVELVSDGPNSMASVADKMALVTRNTYRPTHIRPLGVQRDHVGIAAHVASVCAIQRLPGKPLTTVSALADMVERDAH